MHELSVCLALIEQVQRIAAERSAARVSRIVLQVGPLSGVEADLLRNAYPLAAAGTAAEDADLVIEAAAIVVSCGECGAESAASANRLLCASCGGYRTRVVSGDEMILKSLELEKAPGVGDTAADSKMERGPEAQ
jgi:hydrogenase nickel incorporation protein HypA/HybF